MTKKIFISILSTATAALLLCCSAVTFVLYGSLGDAQREQMRTELRLASQGTERLGVEYLRALDDADCRLTWVAEDGTVLYDTDADAAEMENHGDRIEIRKALVQGVGESTRRSDTLTRQMLYRAERLEDGSVLRAGITGDSLFGLLLKALFPVVGIFFVVVLLCMVIARRMATAIVEPLNRLDLAHPAENDAYEELSPMLTEISRQHKQIAEQVEQLRRKTDEFDQITASMREGLVLLDGNGKVLSMNRAAQEIFGVEAPESCDFLTVDRSPEMSHAVADALAGQNTELACQKNGRDYRFSFSSVVSGGKTLGAVLLGFDVTDKTRAEQSRREFSANVSHELKTPLQSIIGSAELLESGLVKTADQPRFAGHIKREAARLVTLINDIIQLSQLDENAVAPREEVDLTDIAREAAEALTDAAAQSGVAITVEGDACPFTGVHRYLYEIVYNLCENAVRYNRPGGSVTVKLARRGEHPTLTVTDTGIGIAPEEQERVFERFYRVDKSHSRETGGTGLGLSIVKHAVQYHGGRIELASTPGQGTTVTVIF